MERFDDEGLTKSEARSQRELRRLARRAGLPLNGASLICILSWYPLHRSRVKMLKLMVERGLDGSAMDHGRNGFEQALKVRKAHTKSIPSPYQVQAHKPKQIKRSK